MERNYWQEYWDSFHKFMDEHLIELQNEFPEMDIENEYVEVASLLQPNDPPLTLPGGGQSPTPFISPGGGQFTINNCRRRAIVRIEMRRGFSPSNFFMVVDRADRRSIQGFRIACESGRVRFVPMAVEYRNINFIECAF
ncbi:MAG: hypothetical protein RSD77_03195 [Romboutsia sp.]